MATSWGRPSASPEYYGAAHQGELDFYKLGFEGTRRWRALKLWLSWKHLGTEGLGRLVEATSTSRVSLRRAAESPDFEVMPDEPEASVVCFRHLPADGHRADASSPRRASGALQAALEVSGDGWLSTTRLRGATWLRAGVLNYMTTEADIDRLLGTLRSLAAGLPPA